MDGVSARETVKPGCHLDDVRRGLESREDPPMNVTHAVLQAGSIDLQAYYAFSRNIKFQRNQKWAPPKCKEDILEKYSHLISAARNKYPHAKILVAAAPPRNYNKFGDLANWVHMFNKDLQDLAARTNCGFIRAAPLHPKFYKPDGIHFTEEGVKDYAQRVVGLINHEFPCFRSAHSPTRQ